MLRGKSHWPTLSGTPLFAAVAALLLGLAPRPAQALTPQDPQVLAAVDKALGYLLSIRPESRPIDAAGSQNSEIGMQCLVAVALLKVDVEKYRNHPLVRQAVDNLKASMRSGTVNNGYYAVYNLGIGMVMFGALKDREGAQMALKHLLPWQFEHGGFSTPGGDGGGDTSMTQYAVLGMWEASQLGLSVPPQAWQRVAGWLVATQDPREGTHLYHPKSLTNVAGLHPPHSMTAAGLSSMYICANYTRPRGAAAKPEEKKRDPANDVPSALTPVGEKKKEGEKEKAAGPAVNVDMGRLQGAMARGDAWLERNFGGGFSLQSWQHYYLYAIERYYAFRERWENVYPEEPEWYTKGASFLIGVQRIDGSWAGDYNERAGTCFALLFLVRNTRKTLAVNKPEEKAGGTLLSGSGLPTDLTNIRVRDGQIVVKPLAGPAGDLLEIMEKPDDPRFLEAVEGFGELVVKADDIMLSPHLVRLRNLAKSPSAEARASAVTALGKSRNLDFVPTLIFALRDEDQQVMRAAWEALKFVSRRFDSFGMSPDFKGSDDRQRAAAKERAIQQWQAWYRSVRPDAEFEE
jgi:hypothetical protein